jgi:hypothetical protein
MSLCSKVMKYNPKQVVDCICKKHRAKLTIVKVREFRIDSSHTPSRVYYSAYLEHTNGEVLSARKTNREIVKNGNSEKQAIKNLASTLMSEFPEMIHKK